MFHHHTYNQLTDTWIRQASKPQPFIKVTATISTSNYTAFGLTITKPTISVTFSTIADTGCQSCLAGISTIHHLGMTCKDLIPVALQMHAANNAKLAILGAAIIQFSGQSNSGKTLVTCQLIYITDSTDKIFLSREACIDLRLISCQFPSIGEALLPPDNKAISHASLTQQPPVIMKQDLLSTTQVLLPHATALNDNYHRQSLNQYHFPRQTRTGKSHSSGSSTTTSPALLTCASTNPSP